jgi:hypothetical protein
VFAVREAKLLVKTPEVVPSSVFELLIVGAVTVFQQTPRAVIAAPPFEVISPPEVAVFNVIADMAEVVTVGTTGASVMKVTLAP